MRDVEKLVLSNVSPIRGLDTIDKAMEVINRYQLNANILDTKVANPVAFVAQHALVDYGISGIDVIKGNPDQLFAVSDVECATNSLAGLRSSINAANITVDHAIVADGMNAIFTDVLEDVSNVIQLSDRRANRRGM